VLNPKPQNLSTSQIMFWPEHFGVWNLFWHLGLKVGYFLPYWPQVDHFGLVLGLKSIQFFLYFLGGSWAHDLNCQYHPFKRPYQTKRFSINYMEGEEATYVVRGWNINSSALHVRYKNIILVFLCTNGNPHPMNQKWSYGYINKIGNEREFIIKK